MFSIDRAANLLSGRYVDQISYSTLVAMLIKYLAAPSNSVVEFRHEELYLLQEFMYGKPCQKQLKELGELFIWMKIDCPLDLITQVLRVYVRC